MARVVIITHQLNQNFGTLSLKIDAEADFALLNTFKVVGGADENYWYQRPVPIDWDLILLDPLFLSI